MTEKLSVLVYCAVLSVIIQLKSILLLVPSTRPDCCGPVPRCHRLYVSLPFLKDLMLMQNEMG